MNKQNTKISMVATPLVIVCGLLLSGASAMAQSEAQWDNRHRSCSNRTLYGDYGFTVLGTIALPGGTVQDGAGLPVRGVVLTHYDGKGNPSRPSVSKSGYHRDKAVCGCKNSSQARAKGIG